MAEIDLRSRDDQAVANDAVMRACMPSMQMVGRIAATVLGRGKWRVLTMLVPPAKSGRACAWLRSRRAEDCAAHLPRPALRAEEMVSGRGAPRQVDARARRAASNKELCVRVVLSRGKSSDAKSWLPLDSLDAAMGVHIRLSMAINFRVRYTEIICARLCSAQ